MRKPKDLDDVLNTAKERLELTSDNQLALKLGITRATVSAWRRTHGVHKLQDETLKRLSEASGYSIEQILSVIFQQKMRMIQKGLAGVAVFFLLSSLLGPGKAMAGSPYKPIGELFYITHFHSIHYTKLVNKVIELVRRFTRLCKGFFAPVCHYGYA